MNKTKHKLPTLQEIKEAHGWKRAYERYLPLSRYLFRPVGFWLTWAAVRMGLTSEAVSWLSGAVGLTGCALLVSGVPGALPTGLGLLFAFNLLDCVDGSIARTMKTQNPYGRFLDSVCGGIIDLVFWLVVGIMAFQHPQLLYWPNPLGYGPTFWLAVGGVTCVLYQVLALLEHRFDMLVRPYWQSEVGGRTKLNLSREDTSGVPSATHQDRRSAWPFRLIVATNLRVRETHYFLLVVAYLSGAVDILLSAYLVFYLTHSVLLLVIYSKRGQQIRQSHQAPK